MQVIFKIKPIQTMDKKGFIKRDLAAERSLTSHMKSRDDLMSDDEGEQKQNTSNFISHDNNSNQNSGKFTQFKEFVKRNPYLKDIMRETKQFISKKSASLMEYFNFSSMNPFESKNNKQSEGQIENNPQANEYVRQSSLSTASQQVNNVQKVENQSSSSKSDEPQVNFVRSDSSIGSNLNKVSQNDSMSISSRVHQFIEEQKNQIRERQEKRVNSLNQSFRSVSNNLGRNSVQSESLLNKRQSKLMENILMHNSKKIKSSSDEISNMPLNKCHSIRFKEINKALEDENIEQEYQDNFLSTLTKKATSYSLNGVNSLESQKNLKQNQEQEKDDQKQKKLEQEAKQFVSQKLSQKNKIRIQLKRVFEMKKQARKLNIDYSQYAEELHKQQQQQKTQKQLANQSDKLGRKGEKYQAKLTAQQLKELNKTSSNYQQFLQDPEVVLQRENSYITYKSEQGDSKQISQYKLSHEGKKLQKQQKQKKNGAMYSYSQSISEVSSPPSSSDSLSSKQNQRPNGPFDDECSMSSIQRHSDDEDSAINLNIFPIANTPTNNNQQNINSSNNMNLSQQLFKKPLEKKLNEEQPSLTMNKQTSDVKNNEVQINNDPEDTQQKEIVEKSQTENNKIDLFTNIIPQNSNQIQPLAPEQQQQILSTEKTENNQNLQNTGIFSILNKTTAQESSVSATTQNTQSEKTQNSLFSDIKNPDQNSLFKTIPNTETKPTSNSLFSNLTNKTETKPSSNSLFSNLSNAETVTKPPNSSLFSNSNENTEIKPNSLFSDSTKVTENIKANSLFSSVQEQPKSDSLFSKTENKSTLFNQDKQETKQVGLFSSIQPTQKEGGLFSNLTSNNKEKEVPLNEKTPEKNTQTITSKQELQQNENKVCEEIEMGNENANKNTDNNLMNGINQSSSNINDLQKNNNSQLLSTPQPSANQNTNNMINPFGVTQSPFSQNNPFSSSQKQPISLNDLVKNNNFNFSQPSMNQQMSNSDNLFQQNNQSSLFSSNNNLFQQSQNNVFSQNQPNNFLGNISSFQQNQNQTMNTNLNTNNNTNMFGQQQFNQQPINSFNPQTIQNNTFPNAMGNNNFFQTNNDNVMMGNNNNNMFNNNNNNLFSNNNSNNMFGNTSNNVIGMGLNNQFNPTPQTNFFGDTGNNMSNSLFNGNNNNMQNSFMNSSQNAASMFGSQAGVQQSLFGSSNNNNNMTSSSGMGKKKNSTKQRI